MYNDSVAGVTAETLSEMEKVFTTLAKDASVTTTGITTASGLEPYILEAPAKFLVPVDAVLRNRFPRGNPVGGTGVHWENIININAGKLKAGVPEGLRNAKIQMTTVPRNIGFVTLGLDNSVTQESEWQGKGFQDIRPLAASNLLYASIIEEEKMLLHGNTNLLGKPTNLAGTSVQATIAASGIPGATAASNVVGSLVPTDVYDFGVSALTGYGWQNDANGHDTADSVDETDAALASVTIASGRSTALLTWTPVSAAVGYNVYARLHSGSAAPFLYERVWEPFCLVTDVPTSGNVPNTVDKTADPLAFPGVLAQIAASDSAAYVKDLGGFPLTGDGTGGIVEWDALLLDIWRRNRCVPSLIVMSADENYAALAAILQANSTNMRMNLQIGPDGSVAGGTYLGSYRSKLVPKAEIELVTHPFLSAGTTLFLTESLPFPTNNVGKVWDIQVSQPWFLDEYAHSQRSYDFGTYTREALRCQFTAAQGLLTSVGPDVAKRW